MGAPDPEEGKPLMGPNTVAFAVAAEPPSGKIQTLRSWRFPLWHVCGDCSPEDVTAGCMAWHSPVIAFGWNMRRALQRGFWREVLKIVLVLGGAYLVLSLSAQGLMFSCAPEHGDDAGLMKAGPHDGPHDHHHDDHDHDHHHDDHDHDHDHHHDHDLGGPNGKPCDHAFAHLPAECRARVIGGMAVILLVAAVVVGVATVYAARRRQQMREQFGIDGTFRGDVLAWLCCAPCALAQETRTLMGAQVHDGVWYGPVPGAAVAASHGVPAAQQMV